MKRKCWTYSDFLKRNMKTIVTNMYSIVSTAPTKFYDSIIRNDKESIKWFGMLGGSFSLQEILIYVSRKLPTQILPITEFQTTSVWQFRFVRWFCDCHMNMQYSIRINKRILWKVTNNLLIIHFSTLLAHDYKIVLWYDPERSLSFRRQKV